MRVLPERIRRWKLGPLLAGTVPWALLGAIYWPTAVELVRIWQVDPNYSHGFAVPLLSLGFCGWAVRQRPGLWGAAVSRVEFGCGVAEVAGGLGLHFLALLIGQLFLDVVALICLLRGVVLMLAGREANRALGFAALFLVFMAPLPVGWYQPLARLLQQLVSAGAAIFFQLCGIAVYREGYLLHLPGYTLEVGEACSGLRQLTAVLALAVVVGQFTGARVRIRWALALAAMPAAVAANCLRVMLAGLVLRWWGPAWADGVLHTLEGVATMALASGLLLGLAWLWSRRPRDAAAAAAGPPGRSPADCPAEPQAPQATSRNRWLLSVGLLSVGWLSQLALQRHLAVASPPPPELTRPLADLPLTAGAWRGWDRPVDDPRLQFGDARLRRTYRGPGGTRVDVWMVYSRLGADRGHHPEVCLAVAGQPEDASGRAAFPVPGHQAPIQQYRFGGPGERQLVYYWHYTLRPPADDRWDALQRLYQHLHQPPASVTVELFVPEQDAADQARAREFACWLDGALQAHLPPTAVRGSQAVPVEVVKW